MPNSAISTRYKTRGDALWEVPPTGFRAEAHAGGPRPAPRAAAHAAVCGTLTAAIRQRRFVGDRRAGTQWKSMRRLDRLLRDDVASSFAGRDLNKMGTILIMMASNCFRRLHFCFCAGSCYCGPWAGCRAGQSESIMTESAKIRVETRDPVKNKGTGTRVARRLRAAGADSCCDLLVINRLSYPSVWSGTTFCG